MVTKRNALQFFTLISLFAAASCSSKHPKAGEVAAGTKTDAASATSAGGDAKSPPKTSQGPAESNLTQVEAQQRAAAVANVHYTLKIKVTTDKEIFRGKIGIDFDVADLALAKGLFLDFKDGAILKTEKVNGEPVANPAVSGHRITFADGSLKVGKNHIDILYSQLFSHDGRGLHRFEDPEDQKVYLYTQFEAFDAHQMFPCFDQPDIKATMTLSVSAPSDWTVITTTLEDQRKFDKENVLWEFPETPRLSTYLFSLHAGPYEMWKSRSEAGVPLRLFARQSLAKFINPKDWFVPTQQGLKFYGDYFAYPYPFKKYDQIIAPDFNAGAMENVAAVTFSERFVNRGSVTRENREHLASVILHEMAHMWFGDLVTMKWWNGLWLNESFATFMSALSQQQATEFKESWTSFHTSEKSWAYWEDQLVTTHPIEGKVTDTASAFVQFDGITYGKGASVLKQLNYFLGDKTFRSGVRSYFKKHAFSNTELEDFIGSLAKASNLDLKVWSDGWLRESGVDTVSADYECKDNLVSRFALKLQGPDGKASSRSHRTLVTLFKKIKTKATEKGKDGFVEKIAVLKSQSLEYKGESTDVKEFVGLACPAMVYPNDQDQDYVKVQLDATTLTALKAGELSMVDSPFTRTLYWQNLYQMVRDSQLLPQDYLKIAFASYPAEKDLKAAQEITEPLESVLYYLPVETADQQKTQAEWAQKFEDLFWNRAKASEKDHDWQTESIERFVATVRGQTGRDRIASLLDGKEAMKGFDLDVDHRWAMIYQLASLGDERADGFVEAQKGLDKSERGVQQAMAAEAVRPKIEVKREWFQKAIQQKDAPFARSRAALRHILPSWQDGLKKDLAASYFSELPKVAADRESEFVKLFTNAFMPADCTLQSTQSLDAFLKTNESKFPPVVTKSLKIGHQENERCAAIRTKAAAG